MMSKSKKLKGVAVDPSPYAAYEDARTRLKHQTLMQDYEELQKEAESMRNKLEAAKQRRLTLLGEVRFLRRRHKYLLTNKSKNPPQERENFEIQGKKIKENGYGRKKATLQKVAPSFDVSKEERFLNGNEAVPWNPTPISEIKQKKRICTGKELNRQSARSLDLNQKDLNHKERIYDGKGATIRNSVPSFDLNLNEWIYSGKEAALRNSALISELNKRERTHGGKQVSVQNRAPFFDLNQISNEEEEEFERGFEPLRIEELKSCRVEGGNVEQHNDLKLSVCRNVGSGSNIAGKRKISWQDQVALRV